MNTLVIEQTEQGDALIDIYSKLSKDRIFFVSDIIDEKQATDLIASLILKDSEKDSEKITIFLNSNGGDIRNIFMIYDTMMLLKSPIEIVCNGIVSHESILLLAAGTKGMRYATQHSNIVLTKLVHESSYYSDLTDAKKFLDRFKKDNKEYIACLAKHTSKTVAQIEKDSNNKLFLSPQQAVKYGLIDKVVKNKS